MTDLSSTVIPKSDQLNADSLISGPVTIKITKVSADPASPQQPIVINFEGDTGKPYKPCKSMRRVMINAWGADGSQYVGRTMTLFRDAEVSFGGMAVGGIRISHMSHIERDVTMALTASQKTRKPYTVKRLVVEQNNNDALLQRYEACATEAEFTQLEAERKAAWPKCDAEQKLKLKQASDAAAERIKK